MKINDKILSIPPYISTGWDNVRTLHVKENTLVVSLKDGEIVTVPNLSHDIITSVFSAHAAYLEHKTQANAPGQDFAQLFSQEQKEALPFQLGIGNPENLGSVLHHNPAQRNAPALPSALLEKIAAVAKIIAPDAIVGIPKPEEGCNCLHCQIARALHSSLNAEPHDVEEEVLPEDLTFRQWDVVQTGDNLYTVTNTLDPQEKYSVFLGNPIGCTCGQPNCEHIVAVLKS